MNSKQLANVLIKILGLSIAVHALPLFIYNLINAMLTTATSYPSGTHLGGMLIRNWAYVFTTAIEAFMAILFIVGSDWVADILFPAEHQGTNTPPAAQR